MTDEEYKEAKIELEEYKEDVLSEVRECQETLDMFNGNKKLVLKQEGFKKGGQSW